VRHWLGVVSREHVRRGIGLGIAQVGHGRRSGLDRMEPGDTLIYYSPHVSLEAKEPLRAFTALGRIADDELWQADEGGFKPWRRRVEYEPGAHELPLSRLSGALELTGTPNWGYQLRRGLIELSEHDHLTIRAAMLAG
jgi:hypothetical protein